MAVKVLVSREFECVSVSEAVERFRSLSDTGWSVLVDADSASQGVSPAPPQDVAGMIAAIIARQKCTLSALGRALGVTTQTLYNWRHGKTRPQGSLLVRLMAFQSEDVKVRKKSARKSSRSLSQDDILEIAVRVNDGQPKSQIARDFGISRSRVRDALRKVGA
jgi:transposase-like protein